MTIDIRITTLDPVQYGPEDEQIAKALATIGFVRSRPGYEQKRVVTGNAQLDHDTMVEEEKANGTYAAGQIVDARLQKTYGDKPGIWIEVEPSVVRPRGKPMPGSGRARRTKEEIAEDEAAQKAEDALRAAGEETGAIVADKQIADISTGEERVDPDNPEDAAADAADEAAETAQTKAASGGKLTLDDVRNALGVYVQKFGLDAAQSDGPKVLKMVCGDGVEKISAIPDDQAIIAKVVAGIEEMTGKNPFKREAAAAKVA